MRPVLLATLCIALVAALGACRFPTTGSVQRSLVYVGDLPVPGTPNDQLQAWFIQHEYTQGPTVQMARADLIRAYGEPWTYSRAEDKHRWYSAFRNINGPICTGIAALYYRLDADNALLDIVPQKRSGC